MCSGVPPIRESEAQLMLPIIPPVRYPASEYHLGISTISPVEELHVGSRKTESKLSEK
jgi:hypothetical protein